MENPLDDEDLDYDPLADDEEVIPSFDSSDETHEEQQQSDKVIVYKGKCRAYDKNTTSDKGDVLNSFRGLALPVDREGWIALGTVPREGDTVIVDRGTHKEYGRVVDVNAGNFGGTHLVWKYGRQ